MISDTPEIEPPDPDPRKKIYILNGLGSPKNLFRFGIASNNYPYRLKVEAIPKIEGQRIIFKYDSVNEIYTCIACNSLAEIRATSREIWGDPGSSQNEVRCTKGPYCPHCEIYPNQGRLSPISKRNLEEQIKEYEELEKKGIQQII
jgi:hypothetical protein